MMGTGRESSSPLTSHDLPTHRLGFPEDDAETDQPRTSSSLRRRQAPSRTPNGRSSRRSSDSAPKAEALPLPPPNQELRGDSNCPTTEGMISRQYSSAPDPFPRSRPLPPALPPKSWNWDWASELWQFMTRLSGRRRIGRVRLLTPSSWTSSGMTSFLHFIVMTLCLLTHFSDGCSSRSTPKPRPPSPTLRPNITIQTYTCPPEYDAHYCLNGATCFTVKIGESILYNCECSEGYMGQRCEFKDLEGSYLPSKHRAMLEQAGITSGVLIIVILVVILLFYLYVSTRRKSRRTTRTADEVDSHRADEEVPPQPRKDPRPFSGIYQQP